MVRFAHVVVPFTLCTIGVACSAPTAPTDVTGGAFPVVPSLIPSNREIAVGTNRIDIAAVTSGVSRYKVGDRDAVRSMFALLAANSALKHLADLDHSDVQLTHRPLSWRDRL